MGDPRSRNGRRVQGRGLRPAVRAGIRHVAAGQPIEPPILPAFAGKARLAVVFWELAPPVCNRTCGRIRPNDGRRCLRFLSNFAIDHIAGLSPDGNIGATEGKSFQRVQAAIYHYIIMVKRAKSNFGRGQWMLGYG